MSNFTIRKIQWSQKLWTRSIGPKRGSTDDNAGVLWPPNTAEIHTLPGVEGKNRPHVKNEVSAFLLHQNYNQDQERRNIYKALPTPGIPTTPLLQSANASRLIVHLLSELSEFRYQSCHLSQGRIMRTPIFSCKNWKCILFSPQQQGHSRRG